MKILSLLTAAFFLFAGTASAEDIKGTWEVTKTAPAPWVQARPELAPNHVKELDHAKLVFGDAELTAPLSWMACKKPTYHVAEVPFNGLFEGGLEDKERGLNDAAGLARKLGFTKEPVTSVTTSCGELIYHFADNDTMLFALDNVIYTLTRTKN